MEVWGMWLVAIGVVVSVAAAVFTWVQAHAALESLEEAREARDEAKASAEESARLAGEANAAFDRQAEAQEEANELKRKELTPPDWSVSSSGPNKHRVMNTARRPLHVKEFKVFPVETTGLLHLDTSHEDRRYGVGDGFRVTVIRLNGPTPEKLTIAYRYEDEDAENEQRLFHVTF